MNHDESTNPARLESWKEIAAYLQRDSTTARRWEKEEGLPVHRHSHKSRSSVYAYASEIDQWRAGRKVVAEPAPGRPLWKLPAFALTLVLCLIMVGNGIRPVEAQSSKLFPKRLVCGDLCGDSEANLSPDGRSLVETDWDTGDLAIVNTKTGKQRRLMTRQGSYTDKNDAGAFGEAPVFSPDGRQIAFTWFTGEGKTQFRVTANETGAKSRVLIDNPEYRFFDGEAWSSDGKSILARVAKADRTTQLSWISVSDGAMKPLASLEWRSRSWPSLSPDGRYVVYAAAAVNPKAWNSKDRGDVHIYIVASDGSGAAELDKTAGGNEKPVWAPDGKHVLFLSDRAGSIGLWSIPVRDGKPVGQASLVRSDMGDVWPIGIRSGSYYYMQQTPDVDYVSLVAMTPDGKKAPEGTSAGEGFVGMFPQWSPDGKSISFKRYHAGSSDTFDLVLHSMETGNERTYATNVVSQGAAQWYSDGRGVQVMLPQPTPPAKWSRVEIATGEIKPQLTGGGLSPVDTTVYGVRRDSEGRATAVVATDPNTGQERTVAAFPKPVPFTKQGGTVSRDGKVNVFWWQDPSDGITHFARVNIDGTGYREINSAPMLNLETRFLWTKDGQRILFVTRDDKHHRFMWISGDGGPPEFTGIEISGQLQHWDVSPDGTRLAYTTTKTVSELWAVDNITSALK